MTNEANTTKLIATRHENTDIRFEGFGLKDEKGREVGAVVAIYTYQASWQEEGKRYGHTASHGPTWAKLATELEAGYADEIEIYQLRVRAGRDGEFFGASRGSTYFLSLEAAKREGARKVAATRKRYEKKYG